MIRIKIDPESREKLCDEHYENISGKIKEELNNFVNNPTQLINGEVELYKKCIVVLKRIICSKPQVLEEKIMTLFDPLMLKIKNQIKNQFNTKDARGKATKEFKKRVLKAFSYSDKFVKGTFANGWGAYKFAEKLNVKVCPYCNRSYIFTIISPKKKNNNKTRPQFDHFYDKATFPYLALSFYNLIPSCSICNSSLKGTNKFKYSTHINPYVQDYEEHLKFSVNITKADFYTNIKSFEITLKEDCKNEILLNKSKKNAKVFLIEVLYNEHKDVAQEIILKSIVYGKEKIEEFRNTYSNLFGSKEEIMRFILGNYINPSDFGKRPLAKLTSDIAEQFDLI